MQERSDPYLVLGVSYTASGRDVREAYLTLALQHHPDRAGAEAAERFVAVREAYELLSDQERRRAYDAAHPEHPSAAGDTYSARRHLLRFDEPPREPLGRAYADRRRGQAFQGGVRAWPQPWEPLPGVLRGPDLLRAGFHPDHVSARGASAAAELHYQLELTPEEAAQGGCFSFSVPVRRRCPRCEGGAGLLSLACPSCEGAGEVLVEQEIDVLVQPAVRSGATATLPLRELGLRGGALHVTVAVERD